MAMFRLGQELLIALFRCWQTGGHARKAQCARQVRRIVLPLELQVLQVGMGVDGIELLQPVVTPSRRNAPTALLAAVLDMQIKAVKFCLKQLLGDFELIGYVVKQVLQLLSAMGTGREHDFAGGLDEGRHVAVVQQGGGLVVALGIVVELT
ncbi:hypothetical protein RC55_17945 [Herbaspirillum seropedicae]|nr:hypothetical protein ACP92_04175 [Herbaspirillum seropedicae]NQE31111.1 hypothetical protein [Herbaspirillum seropedicae]